MSIRKLRAGRVPTVTANQYVGERGSIFWNELTGEFRLSNGVTPGGSRVGFPVASSTEIGGIKLGPGVILNNDNQVIIDSAGLSFNFGDFQATTETDGTLGASLRAIDPNQDVNIVSNGLGSINTIGKFAVYAPDGTVAGAMALPPIFSVNSDGQVSMLVPKADIAGGALEIVGNSTGVFFPPDQTGVILHVTGNSGLTSRHYFDANANYTLLSGRRYNGTQLAPTKVLSGEVIMRIAGQAATQETTEPAVFQTFGPARIEFITTQDQQPNKQGGELRIYATANDTSATSAVKVATFNATTGLTATKFVGPLTGNVTGKADTAGNADTVTNGVYTNGSYANPSWITSLAASKVGLDSVENTALSTSTHYIGTTSIQYNRASASQTLTGVSIDGNAGTVTNGVYTTGTGTVTNTMLAGSIANNKLSNSTISGVALGGSLANLTAGYGISFSTGTTYNGSAAITINRYEGVTTANATGAGGNGWTYSLNLGTASGLNFIDVGGNFSGTVTITGTPVVGRITRLVITGGIKGPTTVTVSGLTAANSSNGTAQFLATSGTASSVVVEFYSSTTALTGVYMNCSGAK